MLAGANRPAFQIASSSSVSAFEGGARSSGHHTVQSDVAISGVISERSAAVSTLCVRRWRRGINALGVVGLLYRGFKEWCVGKEHNFIFQKKNSAATTEAIINNQQINADYLVPSAGL
jgi:hypothetical protein